MAAILFGVVFLSGVAFYLVLSYTAGKYQQEVTQKLNTGLAQHIVDEEAWLAGEKVNHQALKKLFHNLMVINPEIEVYLLNKEGRILDYAAPSGKVKRLSVDVVPIKQYLAGDITYPFTGDDPRSLQRHKVFSVAEINGKQGLAGYVYVILGGELYDGINDRVKDSYILKFAMFLLMAALLVALLAGLGSFAYVTRRLRKLTSIMQDFSQNSDSGALRFAVDENSKDEINLLGASFNEMADRIDQQVESLKQNDAQRRELIANVSHDLRTPLTSLHGYLETLLLKDDTLSAEEKHQYLEIANARSKQLNELIGELFELAKLDSCTTLMNVEAFSLAELVQDVVMKFQLQAEKLGIHLRTQFGADLPNAYGDIGLMQRVLDNLIENALRHTPKGGKVSITLDANPDRLTVKVADNGCGIPPSELPHIFDRFYRMEKNRENVEHAGLGLAIAKRILDLHGSVIHADSVLQHGTTFEFYVPVYH